MKVRFLVFILALVGVPPAAACVVTPSMDLDFPTLTDCPRFEAAKCDPLPDSNGTRYEGTLVWEWDMPGCGEFAIPSETITIHLASNAPTPRWMNATIEPSSITITPADHLAPGVLSIDPDVRTLRFRFQFDVAVTWTRTGDVPAASVRGSEGQVVTSIIARSPEQGDYFPSSATQQFLFDARSEAAPRSEPSNGSPGVGPLAILGWLALWAIVRRR